MTIQIINGPIISAGESLSDEIDCSAGELVRITMPGAWTGSAALTFQISTDGIFYNDLFGLDGYEIALPVVVPGAAVIVPSDIGRAVVFIKFRSGTRSAPVVQQDLRDFAVAIDSPAAASAEAATPGRRRPAE
jgi:hypothetical protein